MNAPFLQVDVFTSNPFEGNQLAVFHEAEAIPQALRGVLAREMNFPESTFVGGPARDGTDICLRIFTPEEELPMAGHPTIGTTFALAELGRLRAPMAAVTFDCRIGPIPVELRWSPDGRLEFAWMQQPAPVFGAPLAGDLRPAFARALNLDAGDLLPPPAQTVSSGVPFFFAALADEAAVDRAAADRAALAAVFARAGEERPRPVFVFAMSPRDGVSCYSRMFAPEFGIPEDPATGGASGPLGCYLLRHGLVAAAAARALVSLQGVKMQRPSRIHISIDTAPDGAIQRVRVGGQAVVVGDGVMRLP
jgi:trans-2,3-dihydro-3-hydroxyanthranilate isomerase